MSIPNRIWIFCILSFLTAIHSSNANEVPVFKSFANVAVSPGHLPFWVCGKMTESKIKITCKDHGTHESEGPKGVLVLNFFTNNIKHEYYPRRPTTLKECAETRTAIKLNLKSSNSICVRGDYVEHNEVEKTINWVFDGVKTEKGTVCWFEDCDEY